MKLCSLYISVNLGRPELNIYHNAKIGDTHYSSGQEMHFKVAVCNRLTKTNQKILAISLSRLFNMKYAWC